MDLFGNDDEIDDDDDRDEYAMGVDDDYYPEGDDDGDVPKQAKLTRDLHPRFGTHVFGHKNIENALLRAWHENKLPNAYMFTGLRGIGKATMAYRFAAFLLEKGLHPDRGAEESNFGLFGDPLPSEPPKTLHVDRESRTVKRMLAGSHADMLVLEPKWDEKKQRWKTEIVIEQTRKVGEFLSHTAGEGLARVVIIDAIDMLNNAAANSLLKWLEEPPEGSIFILISHKPGILLPTIRSRCRVLSFTPPDRMLFAQVLEDVGMHLEAHQLHELFTLSAGSIGTALQLHARGAGMWMDALGDVLRQSPKFPILEAIKVAEVAGHQGHDALDWEDISLILSNLMARTIRHAATFATFQTMTDGGDEASSGETLPEILARTRPLGYWMHQWDALGSLLADTGKLYMDKAQTVMRVMESLSGRRSLV